jgi:hypothetical protein
MLFRIIAALMAALFFVAVAVQYNDPDPLRWMALYGAASVVSIMAAIRGQAPVAASTIVGGVAIVWSLFWFITSTARLGVYAHMFDAWEMKSTPIEEAREASGLLIVAVWMGVLALHGRPRSRRQTR